VHQRRSPEWYRSHIHRPATLAPAREHAGTSTLRALNFCIGTVSEMNGEQRSTRSPTSSARVLRSLAAAGFDGFVIDDHVLAMIGDIDTWSDTSPEDECGGDVRTPSATRTNPLQL